MTLENTVLHTVEGATNGFCLLALFSQAGCDATAVAQSKFELSPSGNPGFLQTLNATDTMGQPLQLDGRSTALQEHKLHKPKPLRVSAGGFAPWMQRSTSLPQTHSAV